MRHWPVAIVALIACAGACAPGEVAHRASTYTGHRAPASRPRIVPPSRSHALPPDTADTQYVVISFDGSGTADDVRDWRLLGDRTGARFTFFVSGVYLLPGESRMRYRPPRHAAGASAINYISRAHERLLLPQLQRAYDDGNELGTHFNGHFCAPDPGSVGAWSGGDWASELDQFDRFWSTAARRTGAGSAFTVSPRVVVGERTPCLEGDFRVLRPVLHSRGFRYDASGTAMLGSRPRRIGGLWEFPLPVIRVSGLGGRAWLAMDYNFFLNLVDAADVVPAAETATLRRTERASYEHALDTLMRTSHAPLFIGAHFEEWANGAFTAGLRDFVRDECVRPGVACVTFAHLADVLDARGHGGRRRAPRAQKRRAPRAQKRRAPRAQKRRAPRAQKLSPRGSRAS